MTQKEFLAYCANPSLITSKEMEGLKGIHSAYPFFQAAQALLCLSARRAGDVSFNEILKNTALHTGNRKTLYNLIEGIQQETQHASPVVNDDRQPEQLLPETLAEQEDKSERPEYELLPEEYQEQQEKAFTETQVLNEILRYPEIKSESKSTSAPMVPDPIVNEVIKQEDKQEANPVKIPNKTNSPRSFSAWLKIVDSGHTEKILPESSAELIEVSKSEIIEKFIKTEPRISAPSKAEFYSPVSMAKKSVTDSEEIVTETLAKIYAAQGNFVKAKRIYIKLSLLYPEKNSYFAALIENLDNPAQS